MHAIKEYGDALWAVAPNQLIEMQLKQSQAPGINSFLMREQPHFSSCRPADIGGGQWLMGSEDGALVVNLDELKNSSFVPPLVVTGVSKENSAIDHAVIWGDTIVLNTEERDLTIWFSALDYKDTELVSYAYRMGNSNWTYIGQNHSITLAQMRPGTYQMTIRSTNSNGAWCDNERMLTIIVTPTFWETPWGKMLIALLVMTAICMVGYTLLYIRRIKRKQRETMEAYLALLEKDEDKELKAEEPDETEDVTEEEVPVVDNTEDDQLMKSIIAYMENYLSNSDLTIDDIAQAVAMSRTSLHRKMKQLMGTSPMEFLREARIRKAAKMLVTTTKNVSEIAYLCGFSDPKYFSKCFRQTLDDTPTEYRQRHT
jgi:AraC-like DNA-binding protein